MVGGPIAMLREGDIITLDIPNRRLDARITEEEMTDRRAAWQPMELKYTTGVLAKYAKLVSSAAEGCGDAVMPSRGGLPGGLPTIEVNRLPRLNAKIMFGLSVGFVSAILYMLLLPLLPLGMEAGGQDTLLVFLLGGSRAAYG